MLQMTKRRRDYFILKVNYFPRLVKDSARVSFDEVIALNRNSPRSYMIHSELEKLKLKDFKRLMG